MTHAHATLSCLRWLSVCLSIAVSTATHAAAGNNSVHQVLAGEKGYRAPVLIANPTDAALSNVQISIASIAGPLENVSLSTSRIPILAANNREPLQLSFDVSESAREGDSATIKLQVSALGTAFDNAQPVINLIVSASETTTDASSSTSGISDASNNGDSRKLDLYFVLRVEGSGYIPHWAGGSWQTSGFYETWFRLPYDKPAEQTIANYIENRYSRTHPSCESLDGWRVLGPRSTPIVWSNGPKVTVMDKGPFTLADGPEQTWIMLEGSDWPRTDSKVTVTDLRNAICG